MFSNHKTARSQLASYLLNCLRYPTVGQLVSIIIPVYNDPEGLRTTLESVTGQTYSPYEILVVDNNSTDTTREVATTYESSYPNLITVLDEVEIQSSYAARNTGVQNADGSILGFIDADMTVDRNWIESAVGYINQNDARYLACDVEVYSKNNNPNFFERYELATAFPVEAYVNESNFGVTASLFVTKDVFEEVGLFDHRFVSGGDAEFGNRVHDADIELHFDPGNVMYHPARSTFRSLVKKSIRIGKGKAQRRKHKPKNSRSAFDLRNFLPPNISVFYSRMNTKNTSKTDLFKYWLFSYLMKIIKYLSKISQMSHSDFDASNK